MRQLTIDVEDHIHTALDGWKMIDASICDLHGAALVLLVRPVEAQAVAVGALPQAQRHALLSCVMKAVRSILGAVFGIAVIHAHIGAAAATLAPKAPPTDPRTN